MATSTDEPEGVTTRVSEMRAEAHAGRRPKGRAHAPGVWIVYCRKWNFVPVARSAKRKNTCGGC